MRNRFDKALYAQAGAGNPSGIALGIIEACEEIRKDPHWSTEGICKDPAVRLLVHQLASICEVWEMFYDFDEYARLMNECRKLSSENVVT
jgi:hypothetical protein